MLRFVAFFVLALALPACASVRAPTTYTLGPYQPADPSLLDRVAIALRASGYDAVVDPWEGVVRAQMRHCRADGHDRPILEARASREGWLLLRIVATRPGSRCVEPRGPNAHVILDRGLARVYAETAARLRGQLEGTRR
ncbi:hypothetical protein [Sandaracinus amylolyticus]|uniref:hypothetical protein n=1 Tax=Sandaracinus amylolyticus TaxID=927083 RepID=UPI001F1BCABA|nr:hypothetical protein [Sandaracinus amylolyticus]UJR86404.1 Hypothetical protein I5071_84990 [Sandaracinus amylolyticus]